MTNTPAQSEYPEKRIGPPLEPEVPGVYIQPAGFSPESQRDIGDKAQARSPQAEPSNTRP